MSENNKDLQIVVYKLCHSDLCIKIKSKSSNNGNFSSNDFSTNDFSTNETKNTRNTSTSN